MFVLIPAALVEMPAEFVLTPATAVEIPAAFVLMLDVLALTCKTSEVMFPLVLKLARLV